MVLALDGLIWSLATDCLALGLPTWLTSITVINGSGNYVYKGRIKSMSNSRQVSESLLARRDDQPVLGRASCHSPLSSLFFTEKHAIPK